MIAAETDRLIIRRYTQEDLDALYPIVSDRVTMAYWPEPFTREQTERWIARSLQSYEQHGFGRWAVILKQSGAIIGDAGIMPSEIDGTREYDLGYIIDAAYWRSGYGLEASQACLQAGIEKWGLTRLCANMPFDHPASEAVALKLGMTFEKQFANPRNRGILTKLYAIDAAKTQGMEGDCHE